MSAQLPATRDSSDIEALLEQHNSIEENKKREDDKTSTRELKDGKKRNKRDGSAR